MLVDQKTCCFELLSLFGFDIRYSFTFIQTFTIKVIIHTGMSIDCLLSLVQKNHVSNFCTIREEHFKMFVQFFKKIVP